MTRKKIKMGDIFSLEKKIREKNIGDNTLPVKPSYSCKKIDENPLIPGQSSFAGRCLRCGQYIDAGGICGCRFDHASGIQI